MLSVLRLVGSLLIAVGLHLMLFALNSAYGDAVRAWVISVDPWMRPGLVCFSFGLVALLCTGFPWGRK